MNAPALLLCPLLLFMLSCIAGEPAPAAPPRAGADNPCAPGGTPRPPRRNIVATTVTPSGQVIDWIPIESQTPDGKIASPPPPPRRPGEAAPAPPSGAAPARSPEEAGVELGPRGPAGTVPVLRPRQPQCDCLPGYVQRADGSCAELATHCSGEGAMASSKSFTVCCPELARIPLMERIDGECVTMGLGAHLCTKCGDGACGAGENDCNCPSDCHAASPSPASGPDGRIQERPANADGGSPRSAMSPSTPSRLSMTSVAPGPAFIMEETRLEETRLEETRLPSSKLAALGAAPPRGAAAEASTPAAAVGSSGP